MIVYYLLVYSEKNGILCIVHYYLRYDWIYVYDGDDIPRFPSAATAGISGKFNSSSLPAELMRTSSDRLIIQFLTDFSQESNFKIELRSGKDN